MARPLDHVLASAAAAAGAALRAPCTVSGVSLEQRHVRLDTDTGPVTAAFVIAADGATGEVARLAGWEDGRHLIPALEYEVCVDDATLDRFAQMPRFDVGIVPHGYAWVFPKTTHLSVGVLTTHRGAINLHRQLEEYLRVIRLVPQVDGAPRVRDPGPPARRPLARERMLLVGDAAGLADPVTAEGISLAALSGRLAADAIIASQLDPRHARAGYDAALRPMLAELRVARTLARLLYEYPHARRWMFRRWVSGWSRPSPTSSWARGRTAIGDGALRRPDAPAQHALVDRQLGPRDPRPGELGRLLDTGATHRCAALRVVQQGDGRICPRRGSSFG